MPEPTPRDVRAWIDAAERIVALTGAGISTDSGIPDFRGPQGVWTRDPGAEKLADAAELRGRSRGAQARLAQPPRVAGVDGAEPNAGHRAFVELERRGKLAHPDHPERGRAPPGPAPRRERVVEIHGTIREVVCLECGERAPMERALARVRAGEDDPPCRSCGGILKSATISFGQGLVVEDLERAEQAGARCDLLLAVGTTLSVFPIAGVVPLAKHAGARVVIVNAEPTEMDALADAVLRGSIGGLAAAPCRTKVHTQPG